jgi:hypothetical protein
MITAEHKNRGTEQIVLETFFGMETPYIPIDRKINMAEYYKDNFNMNAGEHKLVMEKALQILEKSLDLTIWRIPLGETLLSGNDSWDEKIESIAWGILTEPFFLVEEDMPPCFSSEEKQDALKFVLDKFSQEKQKIFLFWGLGDLNNFQEMASIILLEGIFEKLESYSINKILCWTHTQSSVFNFGKSLLWEPFFNFKGTGFWLLVGDVNCSLKLLKENLQEV